MSEDAFILTAVRGESTDIYSVEDEGTSKVLIFEEVEDAQRYVIMLEESSNYIIGETLTLEIQSVPLAEAIDILNEQEKEYIS